MSQPQTGARLFGVAAEVAQRARIVRAYLEADTPFPPVRWAATETADASPEEGDD